MDVKPFVVVKCHGRLGNLNFHLSALHRALSRPHNALLGECELLAALRNARLRVRTEFSPPERKFVSSRSKLVLELFLGVVRIRWQFLLPKIFRAQENKR